MARPRQHGEQRDRADREQPGRRAGGRPGGQRPDPLPSKSIPRGQRRAPRWMCAVPHGFNRDVEKITAASAMSSTMPGAAGPTGTGCSASRSPSTTPTVPRLASRLNGAPPIGARLRRAVVVGSAAALPPAAASSATAGTTKRSTAGRISRSGKSAGSAISVSRLSARMATRTMGITALDITDSSGFCGTLLLFLFVNGGLREGSDGLWVGLRTEISGQPVALEPVAVG